MAMFKKGDRVVRVEAFCGYNKGDEGTVIGVYGNPKLGVDVKWDKLNCTQYGAESTNLKLIQPEDTKMDTRQAYEIGLANCGIEVGDTVKVLRKAQNQENGWPVEWVDKYMDAVVGEEFVVNRVNSEGVYIKGWNFPWFVLELVKKAQPAFLNIEVSGVGDYTAVITADNVKIGCKTITFDKVKEVYEAVRKAQAHAKA